MNPTTRSYVVTRAASIVGAVALGAALGAASVIVAPHRGISQTLPGGGGAACDSQACEKGAQWCFPTDIPYNCNGADTACTGSTKCS